MQRILVTGASGFIGEHLCRYLLKKGHEVRAVVSSKEQGKRLHHALQAPPGLELVHMKHSCPDPACWLAACTQVQAVIHLAGRAHQADKNLPNALQTYRHANVEPTRALACAARQAGVNRLLFLSSVAVYGCNSTDAPFTENSPTKPLDPYAISKLEAERLLLQGMEISPMEVCIVRPPLVHGPGVKGNMLALLNLVCRGLPLPLGAIRNRRSLVGIGNLSAFLTHAAGHPQAAGKIMLVADAQEVSTPELIAAIARELGQKNRLLHLPSGLLRSVSTLLGKRDAYNKVGGDFRIDPSLSYRQLDWHPPEDLSTGIAAMCAWYKENRGRQAT